jgi:hypothetical protein
MGDAGGALGRLAAAEAGETCGFRGVYDDDSDDNADDSCPPNYVHNRAFRLLNSLFSDTDCSWQRGGQGSESP